VEKKSSEKQEKTLVSFYSKYRAGLKRVDN